MDCGCEEIQKGPELNSMKLLHRQATQDRLGSGYGKTQTGHSSKKFVWNFLPRIPGDISSPLPTRILRVGQYHRSRSLVSPSKCVQIFRTDLAQRKYYLPEKSWHPGRSEAPQQHGRMETPCEVQLRLELKRRSRTRLAVFSRSFADAPSTIEFVLGQYHH